MHDTLPLLEPSDFPALTRSGLDTLQVNIGLKCNQACLHCHVNSNPYRKERMDAGTINLVIEFLKLNKVTTLDITGGAPEMHPQFCELVIAARNLGLHVIDRCNLTILEQPGFEMMAGFLAEQRVEIVASLPCYTKNNVDQQRGDGVFEASIRSLRYLNELGYADSAGERILSLAYNPLGPTLAAGQEELEQAYKKELLENFGIRFDRLLTLSNMPIKRFGSTLVSRGQFDDYLDLLKNAHRDENLDSVMCRSLISVDWQGYLYDCDFNQMLDLPLRSDNGHKMHLRELMTEDISANPITVRNHCYACTAGQGSSCGGALI